MGIWDYMKGPNIWVIGFSGRDEKDNGTEKKKIEETLPENFSNLLKDINLQIQEAQQMSNLMNNYNNIF